jgi:hypothetical protein
MKEITARLRLIVDWTYNQPHDSKSLRTHPAPTRQGLSGVGHHRTETIREDSAPQEELRRRAHSLTYVTVAATPKTDDRVSKTGELFLDAS